MILSISVGMDYFQTSVQAEVLLHMNPLAEVSVSFRYDDGVIEAACCLWLFGDMRKNPWV